MRGKGGKGREFDFNRQFWEIRLFWWI